MSQDDVDASKAPLIEHLIELRDVDHDGERLPATEASGVSARDFLSLRPSLGWTVRNRTPLRLTPSRPST